MIRLPGRRRGRNDSIKQTAICASYHAAATEIQITFGPNGFLDYLLYDAYSNHATASDSEAVALASRMGTRSTFRLGMIHLAADSGH
jgi:hypothetical protein